MSALFGMEVAPPALGDAALGLASVLARFDRLLADHAPPGDGTDELRGGHGPPGEADDATFAVLGLVALRAQLGRMLDEARGGAPSSGVTPAQPGVTPVPAGGSLLR